MSVQKPTIIDYVSTFFQILLILQCTVFVYIVQHLSFYARYLRSYLFDKVTKNTKSESKIASNFVEDNLILGEEIVDKTRNVVEEKRLAVNAAKGVAPIHTAVSNLFFPSNFFWKRTVQYEVPIEELRKRTYVYVCNHKSYADFLYLAGIGVNTVAVGKGDLLDLPIYGSILRYSNFLPVHFIKKEDGSYGADEKKTKQMLDLAVTFLRGGCSVAVFPEGEVNLKPDPQKFKIGFFDVALRASVDIVPVAILNTEVVWPMVKRYTPRFPMSWGSGHVQVGTPMRRPSLQGIKRLTSKTQLLEYLHQMYGVNLDGRKPDDSSDDLEKILNDLIELNKSNLSKDDDYTTLVTKIYMHIVRFRIIDMKAKLEREHM